MRIFAIIANALKALGIILGLVERKQDRDIGAALQRGADNESELDRMERAARAGNDPALDDPSGVHGDSANRNAVKK